MCFLGKPCLITGVGCSRMFIDPNFYDLNRDHYMYDVFYMEFKFVNLDTSYYILILALFFPGIVSRLEIKKQQTRMMMMFISKTVIQTKICSCVDSIKKSQPMLYSNQDFLLRLCCANFIMQCAISLFVKSDSYVLLSFLCLPFQRYSDFFQCIQPLMEVYT